MIPPPLREQLIRRLTQKLVDSPTFNSLVHTTQSTIDAFLEGIQEGRSQKEQQAQSRDSQDSQRADTAQKQHTRSTYSHQQPSSSSASSSSQRTWSPSHDFEKPRSTTSRPTGTHTAHSASSDAQTQTSSTKEADSAPFSAGSSASGPSNGTGTPLDRQQTELEAFLKRTKASLDEAERRAQEQRNKS